MKKIRENIVGIIFVDIIVVDIIVLVLLLGSFSQKKLLGVSDIINLLMMIATFLAVVVALYSTNKTLKNQQEAEFKKSRPYFILKFKKDKVLGSNPEDKRDRILYSSLDTETSKYEDLKTKVQKAYDQSACDHLESIQFLSLHNVSQKSMMALQVNVWTDKTEPDEIYKIDLLPEQTELELFSERFLEEGSLEEIKNIDVYFTTELRERVKLVFSVDEKKLTYDAHKKILENKVHTFDEADYNVNNFQEKKQLFINKENTQETEKSSNDN